MTKKLLLSALFLSVLSPLFSNYEAKIEVVVDKKALTKRDIESRISLMLAMTHQENTQENRNKLQSKAIDMLIRENLQLKEVSEKLKKEGIISQDEVNRHVKAIAEQNNMTESQFLDVIKCSISHCDGDIVDAFKKQIRAQLAWSKFTRYLGGHVTELEIDRFQNKINEQTEDYLYDLSEIVFLKNQKKTDESLKKQANDTLNHLKKGVSFYSVAQQFSDAQTANEGGKLGKKTSQKIDPIILKGLHSMNQGDIALFETARGFEIIKLNALTKNNKKNEEVIDFKIVSILFNPQTLTQEDYQAMNYKVAMLKTCKSIIDFSKMAKDLNFTINSAKDVVISNVQPIEFGNILRKSKINDVLDPVQTPDGMQIFFIEKKGIKQNKSLTRKEIEQMLLIEKQSKIAESYMNKLIARSMIDFKISPKNNM